MAECWYSGAQERKHPSSFEHFPCSHGENCWAAVSSFLGLFLFSVEIINRESLWACSCICSHWLTHHHSSYHSLICSYPGGHHRSQQSATRIYMHRALFDINCWREYLLMLHNRKKKNLNSLPESEKLIWDGHVGHFQTAEFGMSQKSTGLKAVCIPLDL